MDKEVNGQEELRIYKREWYLANRELTLGRVRQNYFANRDEKLAYAKDYRIKNRKRHRERNRLLLQDWRKRNPIKVKAQNKRAYLSASSKLDYKEKKKVSDHKYYLDTRIRRIERTGEYQRNNPGKRLIYGRNHRNKKMGCPMFVLNKRVSWLIWKSIGRNKEGRHWGDLVDFTLQELMARMESQFKGGMTWENIGGWHVDHIIPKSWFEFETPEDPEFKKCWALDNLQPMWAKDNTSKGNRYAG